MILFPAIDIKDGKAVRLMQGKKDQCTVFGADPVAVAKQWLDAGANWLHIIDLDGAFDGHCANAALITRIVAQTGLPVQVGGGIRTREAARAYLEAGASRLIIGTLALEKPEYFRELCETFPGRIGVSLDAENGRLKTRGWVKDAGIVVKDVIPRLERDGTAFLVYTDILRDGMQSGVNISALHELLNLTPLPVIVAGGISNLQDIKELAALPQPNLLGAITGRAIYEGTLQLEEALNWLNVRSQASSPGD